MPYRPLVSKIRVHNPNKKGASIANRNFVTYIATREGVSLEQVNNINDFLKIDGMAEQEINESIVHKEADDDNYLRYIAKRPRSQGLFGNIDTEDLSEVSSNVSKLTASGKIIYRGVISLSERDGEALGYRNANAWNSYLQHVMPDIAKNLGISNTDYTWIAAFHAEETHPHVHYMLWENKDRVRSPFIHKATQQKIRIMLENNMFDNEYERAVKQVIYNEHKEEIDQANETRNQERAKLIEKVTDTFHEINYVPGIEYERLPQRPPAEYLEKLTGQIKELIKLLPESGRLDYKFLPPQAKMQLDQITNLLFERPDMQGSLDKYLNCVERTNTLYGKSKSKIKSLMQNAEQDLKKRVSNKILKEVKMTLLNDGAKYINSPEVVTDQIKFEKGYKYLLQSAEQKNEFAQYQLGKIYADTGLSIYNMDKAVKYLTLSAEQGNQYAQCRLGSVYFFGKDVLRDEQLGKYWLERSAEQGNEYAKALLTDQVIGINFSYCLLKGVLTSMEQFNHEAISKEQLARTHSKQAIKEKNIHRDNAEKAEQEHY